MRLRRTATGCGSTSGSVGLQLVSSIGLDQNLYIVRSCHLRWMRRQCRAVGVHYEFWHRQTGGTEGKDEESLDQVHDECFCNECPFGVSRQTY